MKVIDMHCDTLMKLLNNRDKNLKENDLSVSIDKLIKGNYMAQCFACFVSLNEENPMKNCLSMINIYYEQLSKYKDYILPAYSYDDIIKNANDNKLSGILTIEEGGVVEGSLDILKIYYKLGVRMITLTWNYENEIAYPNYGKYINNRPDYITPNTTGGLKPFGIEMVKLMNELGIIIDVSHLSDKGFYDVLEHTTKPIVASHSNSRSVCNHVRNLTDDMIKKLSDNKGVMGINYCTAFVNLGEKMTYVKDLVKHIKHIISIGGIDVVGLGSDFDGISDDLEMKDPSMLDMLREELLKENFNEEDINKIFYKNVLRVFKEVLK